MNKVKSVPGTAGKKGNRTMFKQKTNIKMKALTAFLIICSVSGSFSTVNTFAEEAAVAEEASSIEALEKEKLEGEGYATPEDAVAVYVNGLVDNDIDEMLSAFAVETFVDNYSLEKTVEWRRAYWSTIWEYVPGVSNFAREINIENRRFEIINMIKSHYIVLTSTDKFIEGGLSTRYILDNEYENGKDLIDSLYHVDDLAYVSGMHYNREFIAPERMTSSYLSEIVQKKLTERASQINADEIRAAVTVFYRGSETFVLAVDCVKYGEKWFVYTTQGVVGSLLGIDTSFFGLFPLREYSLDEMFAELDGQN